MRVRRIELRLIAITLAVLWAAVAVLLLAGYRPGGPADLLVGLAALVPLAVATGAAAWPPIARGRIAFRLIMALGVATIIVLLPTIAGLVGQLVDEGLQTLVPSLETGYAWALAIAGTSLFAAIGVARRVRGPASGRGGRLAATMLVGLVLAVASTGALAGAVVANELALRDRPAGASRYGPTDPSLVPPLCDGLLEAGSTARLALDLGGSVDGGSLGLGRVRGNRSGTDFRWLAQVTTVRQIGLAGAAVIEDGAWLRDPGTRWRAVEPAATDGESLDLAILAEALAADRRSAAEDLGLGYVEGARARRCRIAIDGSTFRRAFPQVRWMIGAADLQEWRGELDWWVFSDGQLGRAEGRLGGPGFALEEGAIHGTLTADLTATHRGARLTITRPANE